MQTPKNKFDEIFKDEYAVILLQGKNTAGIDIFSYVKVNLPNIKRLYSALNSGKDFSPSDFGTVLASGEGVPPDEVRQQMGAMGENLQPITPVTFQAAKARSASDETFDSSIGTRKMDLRDTSGH